MSVIVNTCNRCGTIKIVNVDNLCKQCSQKLNEDKYDKKLLLESN